MLITCHLSHCNIWFNISQEQYIIFASLSSMWLVVFTWTKASVQINKWILLIKVKVNGDIHIWVDVKWQKWFIILKTLICAVIMVLNLKDNTTCTTVIVVNLYTWAHQLLSSLSTWSRKFSYLCPIKRKIMICGISPPLFSSEKQHLAAPKSHS